MINTELKFLNNLFAIRSIYISEKYNNEISNEILNINIYRQRILAHILIIVIGALFLIDTITYRILRWDEPIFVRFSNLHVLMLLSALLFLLLIKFTRNNTKTLKVLHITINIVVLILSSLIGIQNILAGQQPFAYIIALFCIAPLVLLTPLERLFIYILPYSIYIVNTTITLNNTSHLISIVFFSTLINTLALLVSNLIYNSFIKIFINNKTIIKQNEQLESMYSNTERILKRRTDELNETLEYEKLRTAFFANISHELRTPLNVIFSAEQMMRYSIKNINDYDKQKEIGKYTHMMKQNCYRLVRLIDNLIDSTKIEAGSFNCNLKNWNIISVVEDICLSVAKYIEDRDIKLIFDTSVEEKIIACDADMIERIMLNLLSNAVKFTPKGGTIFVNIWDEENNVVISVKDTGIGIPFKMKNAIFEKFIQVNKTITREKEGSGIGLSIVKSLIEIQGGTISVLSEEEKGSEFIFKLPNNVITNEKYVKRNENEIENQSIEKINIEFSDIYY